VGAPKARGRGGVEVKLAVKTWVRSVRSEGNHSKDEPVTEIQKTCSQVWIATRLLMLFAISVIQWRR